MSFRDLQVAFARWNSDIARARLEYEAFPTACADWCIGCISPTGSNPNCRWCRETRRARADRLRAKEARSET
jgi:hypothetical protein